MMLSVRLLEWIYTRLGPIQHGDYIDFTERISKISGFLIREIKLNFQKKLYDPGLLEEKRLLEFRTELDGLTNYSIDKLQFMESSIANFPGELAIKQQKLDRSQAAGGKSFLMKLEIIQKRRIQDGQS